MNTSLSHSARIVVSLAAGIAAFDTLRAQTPGPVASNGESAIWSFPDFTPQPIRYSGYATTGSITSLIRNRATTVTWKDLNPSEGVYNWQLIQDTIDEAASDGGALFRLKASIYDGSEEGITQMIPDWVLEKYPDIETDYLFNTKSDKVYVAPWHLGVQAEFKRLIQELCRTRYLESNRVIGFYLHGVSSSNGEEMNLDSAYVAGAAATTAGGDDTSLAAAIEDCWDSRMAWWSESAGAVGRRKIGWVGSGAWTGMSPSYDRDWLDSQALDTYGLGLRHGRIEHYYTARLHPPLAGQSIENDSYIVSDWDPSTDPIRDGRFWGDENEEGSIWDSGGWESSHPDETAVLYKSSFFRAAQLGLNYLWTIGVAVNKAGDVPAWFRAIAGKGPDLSPDAICWLRQATVTNVHYTGVPTTIQWKNMERMLMQRDVFPDGSPIPHAATDEAVAMSMPNLDNVSPDTDYTARKSPGTADNLPTSEGQYIMAFKLDPLFRASLVQNQDVKIQVCYFEDAKTSWKVEVARGSGAALSLGTVAQPASPINDWRTQTFTLNGASGVDPFQPGGSGSPLGEGIDFRIRITNPNNTLNHSLTVRYVRVLRTADVTDAPTIVADPVGRKPLGGSIVHLYVDARGPGTLSYQWLKNGSPISSGNVSGTNTDTLTITGYTAGSGNNDGDYTCRVTSSSGSNHVDSSAATLTAAGTSVISDGSSNSGWTSPSGSGDAASITTASGDPSPDAGGSYLVVTFPDTTSTTWRYAAYTPGTVFSGKSALRFWIKGTAGLSGLAHAELKIQLREGSSGERWNFSIGNNIALGDWTLMTIPLNSDWFTPEFGFDGVMDLSAINQVRIYADNLTNPADVVLSIDDLAAIEE